MNLIDKTLITMGLKKKPVIYMPHAFKSDEARDIWLTELKYSTLASRTNYQTFDQLKEEMGHSATGSTNNIRLLALDNCGRAQNRKHETKE